MPVSGFLCPDTTERPNRIAGGRSGRQCYTWDLPATASTAVLAVNLNLSHETIRLFRIPLQSQAAGSNTCATATGRNFAGRLLQPATCQAQATGGNLCATASSTTLQLLIQAGICQAQ